MGKWKNMIFPFKLACWCLITDWVSDGCDILMRCQLFWVLNAVAEKHHMTDNVAMSWVNSLMLSHQRKTFCHRKSTIFVQATIFPCWSTTVVYTENNIHIRQSTLELIHRALTASSPFTTSLYLKEDVCLSRLHFPSVPPFFFLPFSSCLSLPPTSLLTLDFFD